MYTYFTYCFNDLFDTIDIIIYQEFKDWLEQDNNTEEFVSYIELLVNSISLGDVSDKEIVISRNLKFKKLKKSCGKTRYLLTIEYDYI